MTKKAKEIIKELETEDDTIVIAFGEDGLGVKGNVSQMQHVMGILGLLSALVKRCGGDDTVLMEAVKILRNSEEDEEPEIKVAKLDLNDKDSVKELIDLLKKAAEK